MDELYGISALIGIFCNLVATHLLFFISKGRRRYSNRLLAIVLLEAGGYFLIRLLLLSGSLKRSVSIDWIMGTLLFSIIPCSIIYIRSVLRQKIWLIGYSILIGLVIAGPLLPEPWVGAMAYAILGGGLLLRPGILFGVPEPLPVSAGDAELQGVGAAAPPDAAPQEATPQAEVRRLPEDAEVRRLPEDAEAGLSPEDAEAGSSPDETAPENAAPQPEISKPLFDEAELEEHMTRISAFVSAHQPFKKKGLTLAALAVELSLPQHRLSYIIKHGYKRQFNDFINHHRVEYIKEKMSSYDDWKTMTLDAVGLDAGFSSRSTFFSVFKKFTGQTPSEFVRRLKEK